MYMLDVQYMYVIYSRPSSIIHVHVRCSVYLRLVYKPQFQNESRRTELLAAACAVGVAGTFAAPIGGRYFVWDLEVKSLLAFADTKEKKMCVSGYPT